MKIVGVDIGSRTIGIVGLWDGKIEFTKVVDSGHTPIQRAKSILESLPPCDFVIATGYGRHSARDSFADDIVTEIKAHALGAHHLFDGCRTVIDIGGQDSKVIKLNSSGQVVDFLMNDKCAAGTGKFLETMQRALDISIEEIVTKAREAKESITINSMCTVFAETEVISLLNREVPVENIAGGIVNSICIKVAGMVERIKPEREIVFTGGVAGIPGMSSFLEKTLNGGNILVPENPRIIGALGAALVGKNKYL